MKNPNVLIEDRTRELLSSSSVPQLNTLTLRSRANAQRRRFIDANRHILPRGNIKTQNSNCIITRICVNMRTAPNIAMEFMDCVEFSSY